MTFIRIITIASITLCTAIAWFILGGALTLRSEDTARRLSREISGNLGNSMIQMHPSFYYISSTKPKPKQIIHPVKSRISIKLEYEPRKKGLMLFRSYDGEFEAEYFLNNPTSIAQTIYVGFHFPSANARYDRFTFSVGGISTDKTPINGSITESIILNPGEETSMRVAYASKGLDQWNYSFGDSRHARNFSLTMKTNFKEINMPMGTESPASRKESNEGWELDWKYSDIIGLHSIGMDMPAVLNPGPVAARITFFAPVSLLFFFAVLVILGMVRGIDLHPMNYFFLAAGCFAFQLLFAYLVDLIPIMAAFSIAAVVSLTLVTGYLWLATGKSFARISAMAQFCYMVLFSYSFFFGGLTGISITIGAIATLALLMVYTASVDWTSVFSRDKKTVRIS